MPHERLLAFGSCLGSVLAHTSKKCILIVSGDLSHKGTEDGPYGFDPSGPVFDALFGEIIKSGDLMRFAALDVALCEAAAECGLSGFHYACRCDRGSRRYRRLCIFLLSYSHSKDRLVLDTASLLLEQYR